MVITDTHTDTRIHKIEVQRSVNAKDGVETNGRTDRRTDIRTLPVASPSRLTRSVMKVDWPTNALKHVVVSICVYVYVCVCMWIFLSFFVVVFSLPEMVNKVEYLEFCQVFGSENLLNNFSHVIDESACLRTAGTGVPFTAVVPTVQCASNEDHVTLNYTNYVRGNSPLDLRVVFPDGSVLETDVSAALLGSGTWQSLPSGGSADVPVRLLIRSSSHVLNADLSSFRLGAISLGVRFARRVVIEVYNDRAQVVARHTVRRLGLLTVFSLKPRPHQPHC